MAVPYQPLKDSRWRFFAILVRASPSLSIAWWIVLVIRGMMPALFAIAMGMMAGATRSGTPLGRPLALTGTVFLLLQILGPIHQAVGANLGSVTAGFLNDDLASSCIRPPGIGHLENSSLTTDFVTARDFDLGMAGPPLDTIMGFLATGLVEILGGIGAGAVLFAYYWWVPPVLIGAWLATHWLLNESAVWQERNSPQVGEAQRHAEYAYGLAMDPQSAKDVRIFGLAQWIGDRFTHYRGMLVDLQWKATKLRQAPMIWSLLLVLSANLCVFWAIALDAQAGRVAFGRAITFASAAVATNTMAFASLAWALDVASSPVGAVLRLRSSMQSSGALPLGSGQVLKMPLLEIRFKKVSFTYPGADRPVLRDFDLTIPAGSSLAIVGKNGAGKTTIAKLLCRLYDPDRGSIEVDGVDLRELDITSWRKRLAVVFQDFIRFELPLRKNVAPSGADEHSILSALGDAGAAEIAGFDTILARGYEGGIEPSGGQWQRIALARALCAVNEGAGVVLLDEPTAQLDVRGETEIFERILAATRQVTTILVSHRLSTVRRADCICVVEDGQVVELGSHERLMAAAGRYRTMFDLQASRFDEPEEGVQLDVVAS